MKNSYKISSKPDSESFSVRLYLYLTIEKSFKFKLWIFAVFQKIQRRNVFSGLKGWNIKWILVLFLKMFLFSLKQIAINRHNKFL